MVEVTRSIWILVKPAELLVCIVKEGGERMMPVLQSKGQCGCSGGRVQLIHVNFKMPIRSLRGYVGTTFMGQEEKKNP